MSHLSEAILSAAQALPEGGLISPKEFLHLASRAAVDQTLTRLAREGKLLRVGRGGLRPAGGQPLRFPPVLDRCGRRSHRVHPR
jgi:hypothetical protein